MCSSYHVTKRHSQQKPSWNCMPRVRQFHWGTAWVNMKNKGTTQPLDRQNGSTWDRSVFERTPNWSISSFAQVVFGRSSIHSPLGRPSEHLRTQAAKTAGTAHRRQDRVTRTETVPVFRVGCAWSAGVEALAAWLQKAMVGFIAPLVLR